MLRRSMDLQAMMVAQLLPASSKTTPATPAALAAPVDGVTGSTTAGDTYAFSTEAILLSEG
jgi:hypothetical protein